MTIQITKLSSYFAWIFALYNKYPCAVLCKLILTYIPDLKLGPSAWSSDESSNLEVVCYHFAFFWSTF